MKIEKMIEKKEKTEEKKEPVKGGKLDWYQRKQLEAQKAKEREI